MGLQDVRAGNAINACKTCRHVATMHLPTLLTTRKAPLQCQVTRQHGAMLQTKREVAGRQDMHAPRR
jgi:hypothetical protein